MRRKKYKKYAIFSIVFIIISVNIALLIKNLEKPFSNVFAAYATQAGNEAINYAVNKCFKNVTYTDLIDLNQNNNQIVSMSVNAVKVTCLKSEITSAIKEYFDKNNKSVLRISAGYAQDNPLLSAIVPKLKIKILPLTQTSVNFNDYLESAGINQVRHCIYLDVEMNITITGKTMKITKKVNNSILIADTIIVGTVPSTYGGYFPLHKSNME